MEKGIRAINEAASNLVTFVDSYRKLTQLQEPVVGDIKLNEFVDSIKPLYPDIVFKSDIASDVVIWTDETSCVRFWLTS